MIKLKSHFIFYPIQIIFTLFIIVIFSFFNDDQSLANQTIVFLLWTSFIVSVGLGFLMYIHALIYFYKESKLQVIIEFSYILWPVLLFIK